MFQGGQTRTCLATVGASSENESSKSIVRTWKIIGRTNTLNRPERKACPLGKNKK